MSGVFQIYRCSACYEVAIVDGEKRDGVMVHGRSPGGAKTRCGGIMIHEEERSRRATEPSSDPPVKP